MKQTLIILVILTICSIGTLAEEFRTNIGGTSYLITFQKRNWHGAFKTCKQKGMELVSIDSEEKLKTAVSIIQQSGRKEEGDVYWTSGTDLGNENNFFWTSNGENFDFEPWHKGQPDNAGNNENCVEIRNWGNVHLINDNNCAARQYFLCSSEVDVHCQFTA